MTDLIDTLTDTVRFWTKSWCDHVARNPRIGGGISLALLKQHGGQKIDRADRERLAMGLHSETLHISGAPNLRGPFSKADWMCAAGLADEPANPTKRLNEYVLPPYGLPNVATWELRAGRLSASARNYARLIDALLEFTDEDTDQVCQRIFAGSSFAATTADAGRYERLAAQLNELVAQTDKLVERIYPGASLEQLFRRTAEVKAKMLRAGYSSAWWPYFGRNEPVPADDALPDPYWELSYVFPYTTVDPSNPAYRYMLCPPLDWLDALMHLPRAYLGCAAHVPNWVAEPDAASAKVGQLMADLHQFQSTLTEERNLATRDARISGSGVRLALPLRGMALLARHLSRQGSPRLVSIALLEPGRGRCACLHSWPVQHARGIAAAHAGRTRRTDAGGAH